jgi:hypothetical protein
VTFDTLNGHEYHSERDSKETRKVKLGYMPERLEL